MKTNQLFAGAALAALVVLAAPAHAQLLGAGLRGGVSSVQTTTFSGDAVNMRTFAKERAALSASGHAGGRVDAIGRVDNATKAGSKVAVSNAESI